jgi:hypothetical protein
MFSMGLFLGLPQDGTPSMLKQKSNNGLLIIDVSSPIEITPSNERCENIKICNVKGKCTLCVPYNLFCGNPMFLSKITLLPWLIRH